MSVQTIFKALIGTAFLIVFSALMIEIFNLSISMHQMRGLVQTALTKSCDLFAQETYKTDSTGYMGAGDLPDIRTGDNTREYISGNIYPGNTAEEIWNALYKSSSSSFKTSFLTDAEVQSGSGYKWHSLNILKMAVNSEYSGVSVPAPGASESAIEEYNKKMFAKAYAENLYTPLNIGITFLDEDTVTKIFRWNLTKLLTNGYNAKIVEDPNNSGSYYVQYNGFRCYADQAQINIDYKVYDLSNSADKIEFAGITGIGDPNAANMGSLGFTSDTNLIKDTMGINEDERKKVCLATITYTMPVSYEGISPIKEIFEFAFKQEVTGLEAAAPNVPDQTWNYNKQNLAGGGVNTAVTTPTSGNIYYYVVR